MTNITIYDTDAKKLEEIADANDMGVYEIVEMLCDYIDEMVINNDLKG